MNTDNNRLFSLDAFRGGVVAGFILQNNPGSNANIFAQLLHSEWNGCTTADLGFPFFLFIMGAGISFSIKKLRENNVSESQIYQKILIRSCTLFLLGILFENYPMLIDFHHYSLHAFLNFRLMGVLQRLGLTYLLASIIIIEFKNFKPVFLWTAGCLLFFQTVMAIVPVPGYGINNLTPDGNVEAYIDNLIMPYNIFAHGRFDPEGFLSTISATATVLFGCLSGIFIQSRRPKMHKFYYLLLGGVIFTGLGLIDSMWVPINKSLWSSSYVLFTGGLAITILAIVYWIIDIHEYKTWAKPFRMFGVNCLMVFLLSSILSRVLYNVGIPMPDGNYALIPLIFYYHVFLLIAPPKLASFIYAVFYLLFWFILVWYIKKKKFLFKT